MTNGWLGALIVLSILCQVIVASAEVPELSDYEHGHVHRQLHQRGWKIDHNAQGKSVAFVQLHRYPVFVEFESLPLLPNQLHVLSKTDFIRREMLVRKDEPFSQSALNESVRNLRRIGVFSLVAAVPVLTDDAKTVGVLVVTRDLWSLRLESAFQLTGTVLDRLQTQLTERNLFGRGIQALLRYNMQPLFVSTGALFSNRRVFNKPYTLTLSSDAFFERDSGQYEGYSMSIYAGRPLYSMSDRVSYAISASRGAGVVRQEQMGKRVYWDDDETPEQETVARSWSYESYNFGISSDIQFRRSIVFRVGGGLSISNYEAKGLSSNEFIELSDESRSRFREAVIPESLLLAYPHVRFSFYRDRFSAFKNLSGFALSEELQLGISGGGYAQFPTQKMGSTQDLVLAGARSVYRERFLSDALVEFSASGVSRYRFESDTWTDTTFLLRFRTASSSLGLGRFVMRTDWVGQRVQSIADPLSLGGDNGIRGYSSQHFLSFGGHRVRGNAEFRTKPIRLGPFYSGAVVFYDAGALYGGSQGSGYVHAVGIGTRGVLPQASSYTYRLDFGVPLDGTGFMMTLKGGTLTMETNQGVPMTPRDDMIYQHSVGGLTNQP
jgi:hypothetical protein